MTVEVTTKIVDNGHAASGPLRTQTTETQVNGVVAAHDKLADVAVMTEVQRRAVHHYVRAIALGTDTSSVETAISAII